MGTDPTFYDAFTTLTAIGAVTERIELGTGSLIPFRHPLETALVVGTMTQLFGDRVIIGHGRRHVRSRVRRGSGWDDVSRVELVKSNARDPPAGVHRGRRHLRGRPLLVPDVTIEPKPPGPVPFWYCGATPASARLAVEYADGWMPGARRWRRSPRIETCASSGRELAKADADRRRHPADLDRRHAATGDGGPQRRGSAAVGQQGGKWWVKPPSGSLLDGRGHRGSLIAGQP